LVAPSGVAVNTLRAGKSLMALMTSKGPMLLLGAALMALAETSWGQLPPSWEARWRVRRIADGLPQAACVSVALGPQGKVLVRHPESGAVSELDGYAVSTIPSPGPGNSRIYQSPGGQLWAVVADGLHEFRNGQWLLHPVPEIAAALRTHLLRSADPIPLCPARQGLVLFLLPDRLFEFNAEDPDHPRTAVLLPAAGTGLEEFSNMALARDGGLWISGARGLAKVPGPVRNLNPGTQWQQHIPPEPLQIQNLQYPHEDEAGVVTALAESPAKHQRLLVRFDGQHWTAETVPVERARRAWRSVDNTCWAMTINSLFEWEAGAREATEAEEGSARQYYDMEVESGGAFWLATSAGLFRYAPLTWRSPPPARRLNTPVHCLTGDESGRLWFVTGSTLHLLHRDRYQEFFWPATTSSNPLTVRSLFPLKNGTLLLDAGTECMQFQPDSGTFSTVKHEPPGRRVKPLGRLRDGRLCVQSLGPEARAGDMGLEAYDGDKFEPVLLPPPEVPLGSTFSTLFAAQNGDLWVSGERGTAWYHEQKWRTFLAADRSNPEAVISFAEQADGKVWCATGDKVWAFDGRNWAAVRAGVDHINALMGARDGSLWIATDSGLYRFVQGAWVENGTEEGLPAGAIREVFEDQRGRIWAGTVHGLRLYHPEADPDPPRTEVQTAPGKAQRIPAGASITLAFTGADRWNYTPRARLLYSCRLDGREWSPFQEERTASFPDLPAGKHYFQVRAMDRNGNVDPNPARLEFAVVLPWYKESRPVTIAVLGLAVALFFAGLAFNRHRQLLRSYAQVEQKVAQRTKELELANRQLLHSQKMNALGTLAAGIAHDFNNILSIIKGSAQIIEDNLDDPQKVRTRVDRIKTVVEQGAGIVKAMLGFSRESDEQPGPCDLNAVVEDTIKLLGDRFLREVQISFERAAPGAPTLPSVSSDKGIKPTGMSALPVTCSKDLVQQVLLNFIFNAAESMTQRKQIVLTTRHLDKLPANLVLAPAPAAHYVAVSVQDFGSGISPETLPRIFEPFFTTKAMSARRGTGLGLSMVYELARKMEAGLAVESVLNQGSTFTLILPARASTQQ
jgi:signal transduction histidine kinase